MNDLIARQLKLFRGFIASYRCGEIGLDTLKNNIGGLNHAIADFHNQWKDDVFQVICDLEVTNALTIIDHRELTKGEVDYVNQQLSKLVLLADRLDGDDQDS